MDILVLQAQQLLHRAPNMLNPRRATAEDDVCHRARLNLVFHEELAEVALALLDHAADGFFELLLSQSVLQIMAGELDVGLVSEGELMLCFDARLFQLFEQSAV